ncbi:MAG: hypothetical protein M3P44_01765 [Actinomycetota bacterium]|nr:hypothetical protein [Actinomycetota bacterium]
MSALSDGIDRQVNHRARLAAVRATGLLDTYAEEPALPTRLPRGVSARDQGIPATGKRIELRGVQIGRFEDGRTPPYSRVKDRRRARPCTRQVPRRVDARVEAGPRRAAGRRAAHRPRRGEALVSLVLMPPDRRLAFDDPAVAQSRRAVLANLLADGLCTLMADATSFVGAITVRRGPGAERLLREDPFARLAPAGLLHVGSGLLGRVASPAGPTIERYGSDQPWPCDRFA